MEHTNGHTQINGSQKVATIAQDGIPSSGPSPSLIINGTTKTNGVGEAGSTTAPFPTPLDSYPDHDFHSAWGCAYTSRSTLADPETFPIWQQYALDPASVERQYHQLIHTYTSLFSTFFNGYYPISMHAHASDALLPTTIASLILNTVATSPLILDTPELAPKGNEDPEGTGARIRAFALDFLGWSEKHVITPNFLVAEGIYGAGFGPLAHTSKEWEITAIASGPKPIQLTNMKTAPEAELDAQFAEAKAAGCIAVVFDMVSTEDGSVFPAPQYKMIKTLCHKHRLFLIVDETMTAIRCGAPFSFQRPEYTPVTPSNPPNPADTLAPDLVIFGKGLGASGIAFSFTSTLTTPLSYTSASSRAQAIRYWRALISRPIRLPALLEALAILRTAAKENWPARSLTIGAAVRSLLYSLAPETQTPGAVTGLGAMIALHRSLARRFRVMSAIRRRSDWIRWLPKLDPASEDRELLFSCVFSEESGRYRRLLSEEAERRGTMPLWCLVCGIEANEETWCRRCFLSHCDNEVCVEEFRGHVCVQG